MNMREIKFRAWDRDHKRFVYFDFSDLESMNTMFDNDGLTEYCDFYGMYQQFTGLYDKNGKEIYEGDIVETTLTGKKPPHPNAYPKLTTVVTYNEKLGGFIPFCYPQIVVTKGNFSVDRPLLSTLVESYEVIGNIYENPRLIKK